MSSKSTSPRRCAAELTDTTRAPPAAAGAPCSPPPTPKSPRRWVANYVSRPAGERIGGGVGGGGVWLGGGGSGGGPSRGVPSRRRTLRYAAKTKRSLLRLATGTE